MIPSRRPFAFATIAVMGSMLGNAVQARSGELFDISALEQFNADVGQLYDLGVVGMLDDGSPQTVNGLPGAPGVLTEASGFSDEPLEFSLGVSRIDLNQYDRGSTSGFFCHFGAQTGLVDVPMSFSWFSTKLVVKGYADVVCPTQHDIFHTRTGNPQTMELGAQLDLGLKVQMQDLIEVGPWGYWPGVKISPYAKIGLWNTSLTEDKIVEDGVATKVSFASDRNSQSIGADFQFGTLPCKFYGEYLEREKVYTETREDLGRIHPFNKTQSVMLGVRAPFGSTCLNSGFDQWHMANWMDGVAMPGNFVESPWYVDLGGGQMNVRGAESSVNVFSMTIGADVHEVPLFGQTKLVFGVYGKYQSGGKAVFEQEKGGEVELDHAGKIEFGGKLGTKDLLTLDTGLFSPLVFDVAARGGYQGLTPKILGRNIPSQTAFEDGTLGRKHNDSRCHDGWSYGFEMSVTPQEAPVAVVGSVDWASCDIIHGTFLPGKMGEQTLDDATFMLNTRLKLEPAASAIGGWFER